MYIPEEHSEEEVLNIITEILEYLAPNFSFGYYDADDMKQEGFIFATEALPKFDSNNGCSLKTFLSRHIVNRFLNLVRNKLYRYTPPCLECSNYSNNSCLKYDRQQYCERWHKWNYRNESKKCLMEFSNGKNLIEKEETFENNMQDKIDGESLMSYVSNRVKISDRADFCRFIEGTKLSKSREREITAIVREIAYKLTGDINDG